MAKPFFRKQTNSWYVWRTTGTGRKCIKLHAERDEAYHLWHEMEAGIQPVSTNATVQSVIDQFLNWSERHRSPKTNKWYRFFLESFASRLGHLNVDDIKAMHVEDWVDAEFGASTANTRLAAVRCAVRPFNWAVKRGTLATNPIRGIERPQAEARQVYIQREDWQKILAEATGPVRDMLVVLRETGCRPHEARIVEARWVDRESKSWVFPVEHSKGKRSSRVVPLTERAWELTQRAMLKNPDGPIFRNTRGTPWDGHCLARHLKRIGKRVGVECTPYSIRHTFVTDALVNGVDPVTLATIVGHKSLDMIQKVYAHVGMRREHIQESLKRAVGG